MVWRVFVSKLALFILIDLVFCVFELFLNFFLVFFIASGAKLSFDSVPKPFFSAKRSAEVFLALLQLRKVLFCCQIDIQMFFLEYYCSQMKFCQDHLRLKFEKFDRYSSFLNVFLIWWFSSDIFWLFYNAV